MTKSTNATDMPKIGTKWTHATEPGVFVVTDGTLNGQVIWTEEGGDISPTGVPKEYYGPVREFLAVFTPVK